MTRTTFGTVTLLLALSFSAEHALAQSTSDSVSSVTLDVSLDTSNEDTSNQRYTVNLSDCRTLAADPDDEITFTWNFASNPPSDAQYTIKIKKGSDSCADSSLTRESTDDCTTVVEQSNLTSDTIAERLTFGEITGVTSASQCDGNADTIDVILIFSSFTTTTDESADDTDRDEVRFAFDTDRPAAPTGITSKAGESSIDVDWTAVDGASLYTVFYGTSALTEGDEPENLAHSHETTSTVGFVLDDGIRRDATYYIGVTVQDSVGNNSLVSATTTATTQPVSDFYEYYRQQGGLDDGGFCSVGSPSSGGLWLLALAVASMTLLRRRRRRLSACLLIVGLLPTMAPASSSAQEVQSAITGELEVKFGEYEPAIDDGFTGTGPYERIFGAGGSLYFEIEYDHYFWDEFGTFAVGLSLGYTSADGKGLLASGDASVDETKLNLLPVRASLVYRFDVLSTHFSIPFVPYVKGGVDYYVWWIKSAAGIATYRDPDTNQLDTGRGGTFGWHAGAGLKFLLDVFSPQMSRALDANTGINNSFIFAEWLYADVDNFGSKESLSFSDNTFLFGLALEF